MSTIQWMVENRSWDGLEARRASRSHSMAQCKQGGRVLFSLSGGVVCLREAGSTDAFRIMSTVRAAAAEESELLDLLQAGGTWR